MTAEGAEYILKVNGKFLTLNAQGAQLIFDKHEDAVEYRKDWIYWSPDDKVEIFHRRVRRYEWALTTPT